MGLPEYVADILERNRIRLFHNHNTVSVRHSVKPPIGQLLYSLSFFHRAAEISDAFNQEADARLGISPGKNHVLDAPAAKPRGIRAEPIRTLQ